MNQDELFAAGRLIQWALRPEASPTQSEEYRRLIEHYLDDPGFREKVQTISAGLGLDILEGVRREYSVVLAPTAESVFSVRGGDYRTSAHYSEDNRLLDGLIHVAVAATVYPRASDLLTDAAVRRNPVTVDDVETTLRGLVERLEAQRDRPNPAAAGLYEAWRVYKNRSATKETKDKRAAPWTTRRMIEYALEYLCKQRCFRRENAHYQPLRRYQVLVQEYAASRVYEAVEQALTPEEA